MLEILGLMYLYYKNKTNALNRGRKPNIFIALTFVLWLVMELIGFGIGWQLGWDLSYAYIMGIGFGFVGGAVSFLLAKNCRKGDYVTPANRLTSEISENAELLDEPASLKIVRDNTYIGMAIKWSFAVNGHSVGGLMMGKSLNVEITHRQNILRAFDVSGNEAPHLLFNMDSGDRAEIHFKANRFIKDKEKGLKPFAMPEKTQHPEITA